MVFLFGIKKRQKSYIKNLVLCYMNILSCKLLRKKLQDGTGTFFLWGRLGLAGDGGGLLDLGGGLRLGVLSGIHERINPKQNDYGHHHRKPTKLIAYLGFFVVEHLSLPFVVGPVRLRGCGGVQSRDGRGVGRFVLW